MTDAPLPDLVGLTFDEGIATITLQRPARLNAFTWPMLEALDEVVAEVNARHDLAGVLVTGAGRAFCAGRDIEELAAIKEAEAAKALPSAGGSESSMFARVEAPIVAAVNGIAVGGGVGFAVQCDWIVASSGARFRDGHITSGMAPSVASWYVPRRIGPSAALRFFAAHEVSADEAHQIGLVDEVVAPEDLLSAARRWLAPFRELDPELVRHTKLLCRSAGMQTFDTQMQLVGLLRSMERRRG